MSEIAIHDLCAKMTKGTMREMYTPKSRRNDERKNARKLNFIKKEEEKKTHLSGFITCVQKT